jgi:F-box domain
MHHQTVPAHAQHVGLGSTDPFNRLSDDVLHMILQHMSLRRILALAATCRALHNRLRNRQVP